MSILNPLLRKGNKDIKKMFFVYWFDLTLITFIKKTKICH